MARSTPPALPGRTQEKIMKSLPGKRAVMVLLVVALWVAPASATLFTGSSGSLAASADFSVVGGNLQVILTNTSTADVLVPTDVLTGLFFTSVPATLTPVSALLGGSQVFQGTTTAITVSGGNVGGEWGYAGGAGASSAGLGVFSFGNFNGPELQGPANGALDGVQYGILSAGDDTTTGNAPILGSQLIKNSVTFTLSGIGVPPVTITNVVFQYGTDLSEPHFPGNPGPPGGDVNVPIPPTFLLMGSGLVGLGLLGWRRRKQ